MNPEVQTSIGIMQVIRKHLEEGNCIHNIKEIMLEALKVKSLGNHPKPDSTQRTGTTNTIQQALNHDEVQQVIP